MFFFSIYPWESNIFIICVHYISYIFILLVRLHISRLSLKFVLCLTDLCVFSSVSIREIAGPIVPKLRRRESNRLRLFKSVQVYYEACLK